MSNDNADNTDAAESANQEAAGVDAEEHASTAHASPEPVENLGAKRLAHHFGSPDQQQESAKFGMWLFLATEVMLFSGLFCAYAVLRANYPAVFHEGHQLLDKTLGGVNTLVLICSSLTMAMAVRFAQLGKRKPLVLCLGLTIVFAFGFLGIKYVEYSAKFEHGTTTGKWFDYEGYRHALEERQQAAAVDGEAVANVGSAATGEAKEEGAGLKAHLFFGVYFAMTGLHGLHVLMGILAILWVLIRSAKGHFNGTYYYPVDNVGLYWHLVDLVWIFLFPLLYLID